MGSEAPQCGVPCRLQHHGSETRLPAEGTRYTHDELQTLVNKALAYHEVLAVLRKIYRLGYREPATIPIFWRRPVEGGADGEVILEEDVVVVMVLRCDLLAHRPSVPSEWGSGLTG